MIYIGTTGWSYNHWRGKFYPRVRTDSFNELEYYSYFSRLNEINTTFYRIPSEFMVRQWYHYTPDDFIFAAKLIRDITHTSHRNLNIEILRKFFLRMKGLEDKFQIVVIQFPPRFQRTKDNFNYLHRLLEQCRSMFSKHVVVEFRNQSWITSEVLDLVKELSVPIIDTPFLELPSEFQSISPSCYYVRLLGDRELIPDAKLGKLHLNKTKELKYWSEKFIRLKSNFESIFIVINNRFSGYAINDAISIREILSKSNIATVGFEKHNIYIRGQLALDDFL